MKDAIKNYKNFLKKIFLSVFCKDTTFAKLCTIFLKKILNDKIYSYLCDFMAKVCEIISLIYEIIFAKEEVEVRGKSKKDDIRKKILFKQVGAKIAYYRTLRDMSQEELAEKANITQSTLSKIERGKYNNNVSVSLLIDIADSLQIDIALLVTFNDAERQMWWHSLTEIGN